MSKNSQIHPCSGKCSRFNGEQCSTCMVSDEPKSATYSYKLGDSIVCTMEGNESWNTEVAIIDGFHHDILICNTASGTVHHVIKYTRHAKPEEKAAGHRIDTPTVCIEQETAELFNSKHCSPRNYIKQYYNNVTDAQRLKELDASVDHAKAALATFNYKLIPTDRELKQAEQIRVLRTDRNVWCAMFFIAVVGYGVARWML